MKLNKLLMIISIFTSAISARSIAETIDKNSSPLLLELQRSGFSFEEIQVLDGLYQEDRNLFLQMIEQDFRFKGKLKKEILATANKGGGPCVRNGQD